MKKLWRKSISLYKRYLFCNFIFFSTIVLWSWIMSAISLSILFVCATKCRKSGAFSSHFDAEKHNRKTTKLPTDVYLSLTPGGVLKLVSSESFPLMGSCRKEIVSHFSQPVFLPYFLLHPRDLFEFPNTLQRDSLKSGFSKNFFFSPLQNSQPFSFSPWETYLKFPHTFHGDSPQVWTMMVDKVYFLSNI